MRAKKTIPGQRLILFNRKQAEKQILELPKRLQRVVLAIFRMVWPLHVSEDFRPEAREIRILDLARESVVSIATARRDLKLALAVGVVRSDDQGTQFHSARVLWLDWPTIFSGVELPERPRVKRVSNAQIAAQNELILARQEQILAAIADLQQGRVAASHRHEPLESGPKGKSSELDLKNSDTFAIEFQRWVETGDCSLEEKECFLAFLCWLRSQVELRRVKTPVAYMRSLRTNGDWRSAWADDRARWLEAARRIKTGTPVQPAHSRAPPKERPVPPLIPKEVTLAEIQAVLGDHPAAKFLCTLAAKNRENFVLREAYFLKMPVPALI